MSQYLPEGDWRHLRRVHVVALDRYCRQVLDESAAIIGARDISNHERYLRLFRLLKDRDGTLARAFDDLRRWDLDNKRPMSGRPSARILRLIRELESEGLL